MRILRKEVEAELRAKHNKVKMLSAGSYKVADRVSLNTALRGMDLRGAVKLLNQEFAAAAHTFGVPISAVRIEKSGYSGEKSHLTATRPETEEERETRLQYAVDYEVTKRRRLHQNKKNAEYQKRREIKRLQAELEELKK